MKKSCLRISSLLLIFLLVLGVSTASAADPDWANQVINWGTEGVYDGADNDYVVNIVQLTTNPYEDYVPCWGAYPWSPDGKKIVYMAEIEGSGSDDNEICIMNADGTGWTRLTYNDVCDSHPSFTPDGKKIVFQREVDGYAHVAIMDVDGLNYGDLTEQHNRPPLTVVDGEGKPMVSPTGDKIAFHRQGRIWAMDIDGKNAINASKKERDIDELSSLKFVPNAGGGFDVSKITGTNFVWLDTADATDLALGDDEVVEQALPGDFPFAGTDYDTIYISSNGFISLGGELRDLSDSYTITDLSDVGELMEAAAGEYPVIAAFATDLDPDESGAVYYEELDDKVVITWDTVYYCSGDEVGGPVQVQMQLSSDGSIILSFYKYKDPNEKKRILIGTSENNLEITDIEDAPASVNFSAAPFSTDTAFAFEWFYTLSGANHHSWSPDGQWILFDANVDGSVSYCQELGQRIYKVKPDGTELTMITGNLTDARGEGWPTWSPDGQWIAYHTGQGDQDDFDAALNIIKPDGTEQATLVSEDDANTPPDDIWTCVCAPTSWSPDSQWIQFKKDGYDGVNWITSVFAYNIATDAEIQLTEGYDDYRAWWSPDGKKILVKDEGGTTRDGSTLSYDLLVINLTPWFLEEEAPDAYIETVAAGADPVLVESGADLGIKAEVTFIDDAGNPASVALAKYADNPTGVSFKGAYFDLNIPDVSNVEQVVLMLFYTGKADAPYWFDEENDKWEKIPEDMIVDVAAADDPANFAAPYDGYDGYLAITITADTTPSISDLTGTVFGAGSTPSTASDDDSTCFVSSASNGSMSAAGMAVLALFGLLGAVAAIRRR